MIREALIHFITPRVCVQCGEIGTELCNLCAARLPIIDFQRCLICDTLSLDGRTHNRCLEADVPTIHISAFEYAGIARSLVLRAKFHTYAYHTLEILADTPQTQEVLTLLPRSDLIIPMPMTKKWFDARIVNHAEIIAKRIAIQRKVPVFPLLTKTGKSAQKQKSQEERARMKSMILAISQEECHRLAETYPSPHILLVDDVTTTGSTLCDAARALAPLHPASIASFTLCKDMRYTRAKGA